jgi:hypothetical protein
MSLSLLRLPLRSAVLAATRSITATPAGAPSPLLRYIHTTRPFLATHLPPTITSSPSSPAPATPVNLGGWNTEAVEVDYSKGPSALDKAARLFFFTEIVRGTSISFLPTHARAELAKDEELTALVSLPLRLACFCEYRYGRRSRAGESHLPPSCLWGRDEKNGS